MMYSHYKTRKRNGGLLRILGITLTGAVIVFLFVNFKQYIFFWKYTQHRIAREIAIAVNTPSPEEREKLLLNIASNCEDLDGDNQLSAEAFFLAGEAHCLLGEAVMGRSFSAAVINDGVPVMTGETARPHFLSAIRCINKGRALSGGMEPRHALILAKAGFYAAYYDGPRLFAVARDIGPVSALRTVDDVRFCALMYVLAGKTQEGFGILGEHGKTSDTLEGRLFQATLYAISKQYTNAIINYQEVLRKTSDSSALKLAHINLGKLYYNQSLFNESLGHFTSALSIDERDNQLKIWIGKNYSALGNKAKARAIWSEVLAIDAGNEEVKKLLNPM
jgi:tetratricopeptide (TPR) repeat protein